MDDLLFRLRERARIRRSIPGRKSVEEGKPDRMADLLEEAADALASRVPATPQTAAVPPSKAQETSIKDHRTPLDIALEAKGWDPGRYR